MNKVKSSYEKLIARIKDATNLVYMGALLEWDHETNMPPRGEEGKAEQMGLLARLAHETVTAPVTGKLLAACEADSSLMALPADSVERVNIREIRRSYDQKTKLPSELVVELSKTATLSQSAWIEARRTGNFSVFRPWLEKTVNLKRQQAQAYGYEESPYDALLDEYEPGARASLIEPIFKELGAGCSELLAKVVESRGAKINVLKGRTFPVERQRAFAEMIAATIGFDFCSGRLDEVVHPFCVRICPGDVRITTRYAEDSFPQAFFGVLHEAGHGLYEMGLEKELFGTPMGEAISLGVHESQSRMLENMVGRSSAFWKFAFKLAQGAFPSALQDVPADNFLLAINWAEPSYIRVEADEISYNLHIVLRMEMEKRLIEGALEVDEVPAAWNARFEELLGIKVPNDSAGCLQDTHWASGLFGYFPTYALGNVFAAQIFDTMLKKIPDLYDMIAAGEFKPYVDWLRENIHRHGMRYLSNDLVERISGKPPSVQYLLGYLKNKYGTLYGF